MKTDLTSGFTYLSRKNKLSACLALSFFIIALFFKNTAHAESLNRGFISTMELSNLAENEAVIIDTRSGWKYFLGHIPKAVRLSDWRDFSMEAEVPGILIKNKALIAQKLNDLGINKDKKIIVYGDPADPWRIDGRIYWMLEFYGFSDIFLLDGGLEQWTQAGGDIARGGESKIAKGSLKAEDLKFNWEISADKSWIKNHLGSAQLAIIDNRIEEEYNGSTPYGSPRGGHIPGAIHIDWQDFFDQKGRLKGEHDLLSILKSKDISEGMEIVVYCTGGVRSAMAYFVFKSLGFSVKNYDGSWWDWSNDLKLPIENS